MVDPSVLVGAPSRLLAVAVDLLLEATLPRRRIPDLLERAQPPIPPESRWRRSSRWRGRHVHDGGPGDQAVNAIRTARPSGTDSAHR
jgi:hypothetical protein